MAGNCVLQGVGHHLGLIHFQPDKRHSETRGDVAEAGIAYPFAQNRIGSESKGSLPSSYALRA